MKPKCVIFDFDGTIADTMDHALKILNCLSEEFGFRQLERRELGKARDMSVSQLIRHLRIPRLKMPSILAKGKHLLAERVHQIELIEHMAGVVRELRAEVETLGILTANSKDNVLAFLTDKNLTVFDFISTVPKLSGKAKKLKAIMGTFDYKEEELLFIGDEIRDVRAAHKAGVPVAAVTWGFNSERSLSKKKPDLIFREPAEILDHFRNGAYRPEDAHG